MSGAVAGRRVPPGPDAHLTVQDTQEDPLRFLLDLTRRYGDVVRYHADSWTVVLVNGPAFVKHVLQDNHPNYAKQGTPDLMMLKPMLGGGLLTSDGESWFRQRRMAQPFFHRERIEAFGRLMTDYTMQMLAAWRAQPDPARPLEVTEEMTRLTTRIVARALFGVDIHDAVGRFGNAVQAMNEYMGNFDPGDRSRYARFVAAHGIIQGIVGHIIAARRHEAGDHADFLSMLLEARDEETGEGLTDRQIGDQVMTMLMAGHETTAKALTWTFYLLHSHPEVRARLEAELAEVLAGRTPTVGDLPRLRYNAMVLQEAMRLYPPVWIISRVAQAPDEIAGFHIDAGTLVLVSPYVLHRKPECWESADEFRPERFSPEASEGRHPFAFFPFSGGPRQCIGKSFATVETQLVLASIVQQFRLRLVPDYTVEPEALVTLRPRRGLPVTLQDRQEGAAVEDK
jgi:cytochrome P450